MRVPIPRLAFLAAFACLTTVATAQQGASTPYNENFNNDPLGTAAPSELAPESGTFYETYRGGEDSTYFTVVANTGGRGYRNSFSILTAGDATRNHSSTLYFPNLSSSSFSLTTDFVIDSLTSSGDTKVTFGLGAFGFPAFNSGTRYELRYIADAFATDSEALGSLRLEEIGGDGQVNATSATTIPVLLNTTYTMTLAGSYAAGTMSLFGSLSRPGASASVTGIDSTPLLGSWFGYLVNDATTGAGTVGQNLTFDNFAVANTVPEPGSALLLYGAGCALLTLRRRR